MGLIIGWLVFVLIYLIMAAAFIGGGIIFLNLAKKESQNKDIYCPNCGNKVDSNNNYCLNCGNKLHINYNDSKRIAFFILGAFLLIQGIVCILAMFFQIIIRIIIACLSTL